LGPAERISILSSLSRRYRDAVDAPEVFFPQPPAPDVDISPVRGFGGGQALDLRWPSAYEPFAAEVATAHLSWESNDFAHTRLFAHSRPRATIVLIHGYLGGDHGFEERAWPVRWLFDKGLDVALFVLPLHGARRPAGRPKFPSSDPRLTIEGFRQTVWDFRSLQTFLTARGSPTVGVMGMSLGGYSAALLSTLVADLAFAIPFIPLASIADFARDGGRFVGSAPEQRLQHRQLEETLAAVSPLSRPCRVSARGRLVVGARGDRITPPAHAQRLASHLDAPLELFTGGHLLQLGRRRGFRAVRRLLGGLGLLDGLPR